MGGTPKASNWVGTPTAAGGQNYWRVYNFWSCQCKQDIRWLTPPDINSKIVLGGLVLAIHQLQNQLNAFLKNVHTVMGANDIAIM